MANGAVVKGAFSFEDIMRAWQGGITAHKKEYPEHNRAIVFATTQVFQTYFGDQAGRIQTNGRTCFTAAKVGTYNSDTHLYIGELPSFGQVDSAGCFDSSEVNPAQWNNWNNVEVHGATCIKAPKGDQIQIIIIVDAVNVEERIEADTKNRMPTKEVLTGKPKEYTIPAVKLVASDQ